MEKASIRTVEGKGLPVCSGVPVRLRVSPLRVTVVPGEDDNVSTGNFAAPLAAHPVKRENIQNKAIVPLRYVFIATLHSESL